MKLKRLERYLETPVAEDMCNVNILSLTESGRRIIIHEAMRTAHPDEPFPLYAPTNPDQRVEWFWIKLKWRLKSPFVKSKSFLNGRSLVRKRNDSSS